MTYVGSLVLVGILQNLPEYINGSLGLNGNAGEQPLVVDVLDQGLGVGLLVGLVFGVLGVAREGGLVVEAVEIAAGLLELLDPFLGLYIQRQSASSFLVKSITSAIIM